MLFKDFLEIDEMSTVSRSSNMFIAVNPDNHRVGDEYFKLYNANILNNADKLIRIQFRKPRYVFHKNTGFEDWILTIGGLKYHVFPLEVSSSDDFEMLFMED